MGKFKRDSIKLRPSRKYLWIAIGMNLVLLIAILLRYTPLMQNAEVNLVTSLITRNTATIIIIIIVSAGIHVLQVEKFRREINMENEEDENQ